MVIETPKGIVYLTVIAGRKKKNDLIHAMHEWGGRGISVIYGHGSVKANYLRSVLGLVPEEQKIVITCLLSGKRCDAMMKMLIEQFHFNQPNTGIAFTIPVEKLTH